MHRWTHHKSVCIYTPAHTKNFMFQSDLYGTAQMQADVLM